MIDRAVRVGCLIGLAAMAPAPGLAEPHLAIRTGLRCSRCHTAPTGGGKRTTYGTLFAASSLNLMRARPRTHLPASALSGRGERAAGEWLLSTLATGEVTSWFAVGADLRLSNRTTFGDEVLNSFDATQGTLYLELRPWPDRIVIYLDQEVAAGGARSREAWAMIRGPWSTYVRGGLIMPPFGLRVLDDDALTRRATGANFANSDLGLEIGVDIGPLFVALAVTNGSFSSAGDSDALKALYGRFDLNLDLGQAGVSWMYNPTEDGCRAMFGMHGGLRLGRIGVLGEVDLIAQRPADTSRWSYQVATLAELDLVLIQGLSLRAGVGFHDADMELTQDRRLRLRFGIDLFALRMVELKLYYVLRQSETDLPQDRDDRLEAMLHVYL